MSARLGVPASAKSKRRLWHARMVSCSCWPGADLPKGACTASGLGVLGASVDGPPQSRYAQLARSPIQPFFEFAVDLPNACRLSQKLGAKADFFLEQGWEGMHFLFAVPLLPFSLPEPLQTEEEPRKPFATLASFKTSMKSWDRSVTSLTAVSFESTVR